MPGLQDFFQKLVGVRAAQRGTPAPAPDAHVIPDATRCVQCGVCGHNCPVGIPVRDFARLGRMVDDPRCMQCGQCIAVCPRGTLRWSRPDSATGSADMAERQALTQLFFGTEPLDL
jgi:ferredoxin